jgi:glucose-1-phosphate adenylyltransferase
MPPTRQTTLSNQVLCVVLGGGQGARLFPLTKNRAEPAVPLAGKYRMVDIPISNCLNAGYRRIFILTQFNSTSLHRHLSQTYQFEEFSPGFLEILAAQQTTTSTDWYGGTADAVRKNLRYFLNHDFDYLLILSGDQLYRMDFRQMVEEHLQTGADLTIATQPVGRNKASALGILQVADDYRVTRFVEKPAETEVLDSLKLTPEAQSRFQLQGTGESFLASMGIYILNRQVIRELLDNGLPDFGRHILPPAIQTHRVFAHVFHGYWEDLGAIRNFFEANLELVSELPRFNFFDSYAPIFSHPRYLPGSKVNGAQIDHAVISDGCIINRARIRHSLVGLRIFIGAGTELHRTVAFGCDYYETLESIQAHERLGQPRIGIGANCRIEQAIIDKNVRIGNNVRISPAGKPPHQDHPLYYIRDGIVIIPKDAIIPDGTVI